VSLLSTSFAPGIYSSYELPLLVRPPPPTDVIIHPNFTEVTYNAERRFDIALLRFQDSVDDIPSLK